MISQIIIAIFGVAAIWLANDANENRRKYACIAGLITQPAWYVAAWDAQQWGIFLVSFLYTLAWLRGFRQYWMKR